MTKKTKKTNKELNELNETGPRKGDDRRKKPVEVEVTASERRKGHRRRQIDPTTCEREYSDPEIEFMQALDEYKRLSGRMFPTCSEILEVLHKMGYRQVAEPQVVYNPDADASSDENTEETLDSEQSLA